MTQAHTQQRTQGTEIDLSMQADEPSSISQWCIGNSKNEVTNQVGLDACYTEQQFPHCHWCSSNFFFLKVHYVCESYILRDSDVHSVAIS